MFFQSLFRASLALFFGILVLPMAHAACDPALLSELRSFFKNREVETGEILERAKKHDGETWGFDGAYTPADEASYDYYFSKVLPNGVSFATLLKDRKKLGKSTHIADFFGSAIFLRKFSKVDSLTGVRLSSIQSDSLPKEFPNKKWQQVFGNLYSLRTWNAVKANMRERNITSFDLIVSRPLGGTSMSHEIADGTVTERSYFAAHFILLRRAYELLSNDDGLMFVEIQDNVADSTEFNQFLELLKQNGIEFRYTPYYVLDFFRRGALFIQKSAASPKVLPELPF